MGKKKTPVEEPKKEEPKKEEPEEPAQDEPEDPPIIKELKALDDEYLKLEREYEKELNELTKKFNAKQQPFLDERKKVLTASEAGGPSTGTPALSGFWLQALKNHPAFEDTVEEYDEPVLEFLKDIRKGYVDEAQPDKGFKLEFEFAENPYFTNTVLTKEYFTEEGNPYSGEIDVLEIKATEIDWKAGKNVTVEVTSKKVKGGGAKKAKQKGKQTEEPRDSFFRNFFRSLKKGESLPDDVDADELRGMMGEESDDEDADDDQLVEMLMEQDHEIGSACKDNIVPFAVRWYTGEASPEDDDFDEDGEEEDSEDESESDEETPKGKKAAPKKKGGGNTAAAGEKQEECKQQ